MYVPHPSARLTELFRSRPFQGAAPEESEFLFVGLDANYAPASRTRSLLQAFWSTTRMV